jgi:peptidoglycan L-alanyl-D-glutamate endopeptidase CwlK
MPVFGKASKAKLATVDSRLVEVLEEAIKIIDFTVLVGHRGKEDQDKAVAEGKSKLGWPNSKHNSLPSKAVDIAPYPIDWSDRERFTYLAGIVKGIAHSKGYKVVWGGDWNNNGELKDNSFDDLPHFQIED